MSPIVEQALDGNRLGFGAQLIGLGLQGFAGLLILGGLLGIGLGQRIEFAGLAAFAALGDALPQGVVLIGTQHFAGAANGDQAIACIVGQLQIALDNDVAGAVVLPAIYGCPILLRGGQKDGSGN